ncbi:MAG: NAD(+) diphosphatase, partial [Alphaproteobacteria bacterium]|nr:NAD(+) diphosphatase [Alphaproteobacteria bacterium]
ELLSVNSERLCVFLGLNRRGKALFAVDISDASQPEDAGPFKGLGLFEDLRELAMAGDMPPTELAIMAQGKSMVDWHLRHRFCSACGGETGLSEGGYKRNCGACGCDHFPRTDPVVIMLATHDDACLVGRQEAWGENMFSALAGFMEPGETIEEAVARELAEEAALDIDAVHYVASQPWAFPSSLMIGCLADATSRDFEIDGIELAQAKWVSRVDIQAALKGEGTIGIPPKMAIARNLLEAWVSL